MASPVPADEPKPSELPRTDVRPPCFGTEDANSACESPGGYGGDAVQPNGEYRGWAGDPGCEPAKR